MAEDTNSDISDEILIKAQSEVRELLSAQRLSKHDRIQLEVLNYFLMFLINDRKKINQMYPYVMELKNKSGKWEPRIWDIAKSISLMVGSSLIALLVSKL